MLPAQHDVLRELRRISVSDLLTPQERDLLGVIVNRTLGRDSGRLYQKALADDLNIESARQIGVLATRVRAKLTAYYACLQTQAQVRIELPPRGYEARFTYCAPGLALSVPIQQLVADAKVAIDQRTLPGAAAASTFLDRALALAPGHPLVLALKAHALATRSLYSTDPRGDLETAEQIVRQTRSAASRPWESWFAEGCVEMALHWNWTSAGTAFDQAVLLSGGDAQYQPWYTTFLSCQGREVEAVALRRVAVTRTHDSPVVRADLAGAQIYAGQLDEAEETITSAIELFGSRAHYLLYVHRAILLEARGDSGAALMAIHQAPLAWPRAAVTLGFRALFSGLSGDRSTARRHYLKLKAARALAGHHLPAGQLGLAALGAGDVPAAMRWLREGAEVERDPNFVLSNVYPFFRHLHAVPDFRALVEGSMGLTLPF